MERGRIFVLGVVGWVMVVLGLSGYLLMFLFYRFVYDIDLPLWRVFRWDIVANTAILVGISAFLVIMWMRMRREGESIEDGHWRLLAVISYAMASFSFLQMFLYMVSLQSAGLLPAEDVTSIPQILGGGMAQVLSNLLVDFSLFLVIAIKAHRSTRFPVPGDPFTLENRRFLCLVTVLGVMLGSTFIRSLGWWYTFLHEPLEVTTMLLSVTSYNLPWALHSLVLVLAVPFALLHFWRRMRAKGERVDREQWQELAFMSLGLFLVDIVYFARSIEGLVDNLGEAHVRDGWFGVYVLIHHLAGLFYGVALLALGLYARRRSREERPIEVKAYPASG